jgi:hypothetical protein
VQTKAVAASGSTISSHIIQTASPEQSLLPSVPTKEPTDDTAGSAGLKLKLLLTHLHYPGLRLPQNVEYPVF